MSLGDVITAALPELQLQAESLMVDTITFSIPGEGQGTWNEATGQWEPPDAVPVYGPDIEPHHGMCQVQAPNVQPANPVAGETEWTVGAYVVKIPVNAAEIPNGAVGHVETCVHDSGLEGRDLEVVASVHKTYPKSRPVLCKEVS